MCLCPACSRQSSIPDEAPDVQVLVSYLPSPPETGEGELNVAFRDAANMPVPISRLSLRGDMTHPGMTPWLSDVEMDGATQAAIPVTWSMAGDWVIRVEAELADGRRLRRSVTTVVALPEPP